MRLLEVAARGKGVRSCEQQLDALCGRGVVAEQPQRGGEPVGGNLGRAVGCGFTGVPAGFAGVPAGFAGVLEGFSGVV